TSGTVWQNQLSVSPAAVGEHSLDDNALKVPFGVGEKSTFDVRFGAVKVGSGSLMVVGRETIRGREAWHTAFTVEGGVPFYRVDDRYESWFDVTNLNSLAFNRQIEEGSRERTQIYEIMADRGQYIEKTRQKTTVKKTVDNPLDEGAFLFFVRTIPLVVGQTYDFNRYFIPDRNPVRIRVLRKERVTVPAGTFNAIVIQPIIKTRGIFSEKGQAEVWLSDDETRMLLQLKSKLSFGSLNLYLKSYTPPTGQRASR
ncbi:MAG TPA: DUF3108 domain-containing protein, partial [Gemmatimonadaceae bacterium]